MGNDLLLGVVKFTPVFDAQGNVSDAWLPATAGTGQFHVQLQFKPRQVGDSLIDLYY